EVRFIVGMDCCCPDANLVHGAAEIVGHRLVDAPASSAGSDDGGTDRHLVEHGPCVAFPRAQRFLSALAVVDIDLEMEPANDLSPIVADGKAEDIEPSVGPIMPAMTAFDVVGLADDVRVALGLNRPREILRMNGVRAIPSLQIFKRF